VDLELSPIGFDPERFSCCCRGWPLGPPEIGAINPYTVHDDIVWMTMPKTPFVGDVNQATGGDPPAEIKGQPHAIADALSVTERPSRFGAIWTGAINPPLRIPPSCVGRADTFEEAKKVLRRI